MSAELVPVSTTPAAPEPTTGPAALITWANAASAANALVKPLIRTDFVPRHFRPKDNSDGALRLAEASATAALIYGNELGFTPMQSLQSVFVINGSVGMYAKAKVALLLAAGHEVWTEESTSTKAVACGRRRGSEHVERVVVTMQQARDAGWTSNSKYRTEPATMLLARARSTVCELTAPDVLKGLATVEDLEDEQAATSSTTSAQTAASTTRGPDAPPAKARRKSAAPPPPIDEPDLDDAAPADAGEAPDAAVAPPAPADEPKLITAAQSRKLHAAMSQHGMTDRAKGLEFLSHEAGRDITTSKELTRQEASEIIDVLERLGEPTPAEPAPAADDQGDDTVPDDAEDPDGPAWAQDPPS